MYDATVTLQTEIPATIYKLLKRSDNSHRTRHDATCRNVGFFVAGNGSELSASSEGRPLCVESTEVGHSPVSLSLSASLER
jgi:hypothetical protein